jgi:hypothetical protein
VLRGPGTEGPGFTFSATDLLAGEGAETQQELLTAFTAVDDGDLEDFTQDIQDLWAVLQPNSSDRLASGLDLANEEFDPVDNVNNMFADIVTSNSSSTTASNSDGGVNFTRYYLQHVDPPPSENANDYTDNVFKMLFHADQLDGWLELPGGGEEAAANCTVWNVTETAAVDSGGRYGGLLDQGWFLGELVLLAGLCIPASLAVIIYILRYVEDGQQKCSSLRLLVSLWETATATRLRYFKQLQRGTNVTRKKPLM